MLVSRYLQTVCSVDCGSHVFLRRIKCGCNDGNLRLLRQFGHKSTGTFPVWINDLALLLVHFIKTDELTEQKSKQKVTQWAPNPLESDDVTGVECDFWRAEWIFKKMEHRIISRSISFQVCSSPEENMSLSWPILLASQESSASSLCWIVLFFKAACEGNQANLQSSSVISVLVRV